MHLRLIILSLVVIAFASLALGATTTKKPGTTKAGATTKKPGTTKKTGTTTKKPQQGNCTNALLSIAACVEQPGQEENALLLEGYQEIYNISGVKAILSGLKDSGCIPASAWPDIQAWLTVITPPACVTKIYNGLTKAQKNAIVAVETAADPSKVKQTVIKTAEDAQNIIDTNMTNLSDADMNAIVAYETAFVTFCAAALSG